MDNMKIYNMARSVPEEAKKPIAAGRLKGMTDINPMWRIKRLTEMFGPCGVGWWYEITDKRIVDDPITQQTAGFMDILLYYVDPESGAVSKGIPGTGGSSFVAQERNGPYLSDEVFKMALTDAISVAAKALGIGADVYYMKDRDKYTTQAEQPEEKPAPVAKTPAHSYQAPPLFICSDCGKMLKPYTDANGKSVSVRAIAASSEKKFGRMLCVECATNAAEQLKEGN